MQQQQPLWMMMADEAESDEAVSDDEGIEGFNVSSLYHPRPLSIILQVFFLDGRHCAYALAFYPIHYYNFYVFSPCHCVGGGRNSHPPQSIRSATSSSASPTFTRSFHVIIEYRLQSIYISLSFLTGGPIELQSLIVRGNARSIKLLCRSACTELLA